MLETLIQRLQTLKAAGNGPLQAAEAAGAPSRTASTGGEPIIAPSLTPALNNVFAEMSLIELARILCRYFYPEESATEIGRDILKEYARSSTSLGPITSGDMAVALREAEISEDEVLDAVDTLFPTDFTVRSTVAWQDAGVTLTGRLTTTITRTAGDWTADPRYGMCGAIGDPHIIALPGYPLPGAREGALVGRVGNNPVFLIGDGAVAPAGQSGMLSLCINDDLDRRYGAGLTDNEGTVTVRISCS